MVGGRIFLRDGGAREFAAPESARTKAELGDRPERRALTSDPREPVFGAERREPVEIGPGRSTSGGAWRDRARG